MSVTPFLFPIFYTYMGKIIERYVFKILNNNRDQSFTEYQQEKNKRIKAENGELLNAIPLNNFILAVNPMDNWNTHFKFENGKMVFPEVDTLKNFYYKIATDLGSNEEEFQTIIDFHDNGDIKLPESYFREFDESNANNDEQEEYDGFDNTIDPISESPSESNPTPELPLEPLEPLEPEDPELPLVPEVPELPLEPLVPEEPLVPLDPLGLS